MKRLKASFTILICILLLVLVYDSTMVNADVNIPRPSAFKYANDYVGILDQPTRDYIVSVGKELEDKTGAQSIIVIINSLEGTDIESYSFELFRSWGIGTKEKNNGLLILLALNDRRWKVEVGKGLEGAITDIGSARVMEEFAVPFFQSGNYGEGLKQSYSKYADSIALENGVTLEKNIRPTSQNQPQYRSNSRNGSLGLILLLGLMFLDLIFNRGRLSRFMLNVMFWSSFGRGRRGGGGSNGGYGGFGGGKSGGGGSSGSW
jgi:uncharacterized protein